jgi:hypothetical protein
MGAGWGNAWISRRYFSPSHILGKGKELLLYYEPKALGQRGLIHNYKKPGKLFRIISTGLAFIYQMGRSPDKPGFRTVLAAFWI